MRDKYQESAVTNVQKQQETLIINMPFKCLNIYEIAFFKHNKKKEITSQHGAQGKNHIHTILPAKLPFTVVSQKIISPFES